MALEFDDRQLFADRREAGAALASHLGHYAGRDDVVVLALPRGGVPVADEVAVALGAPFDVFLVRKLGTPGHRELALGAIASGGVRVLNNDVIDWYNIPTSVIDAVAQQEQAELERRERTYRDGLPPVDVKGQVVLLVDDGLATGSTMKAAVQAVRALGGARLRKPRRPNRGGRVLLCRAERAPGRQCGDLYRAMFGSQVESWNVRDRHAPGELE